jgi:hypothetical protein
MRLLFGLLLLIVSLTVPPRSGQSFPRIEVLPPLVRITGSFLNAEAAKKQASIMQLRVNEQLLTLHVREVRSPTNPAQDWSVLRNVGGFLIVKGPADTLDLLLSKATHSEPLVLEGRFYEGERVLMLSSVESLTSLGAVER